MSNITQYTVTLTVTDTEYSQTLSQNVKRLMIQARTAVAVRIAFVTGKVATPTDPYYTIKSGAVWDSGPLNLASGTVYLANTGGGVSAEIIEWT